MTIQTTRNYPLGVSKTVTFPDFVASRRWTDNLPNFTSTENQQGYIYLDSFYIEFSADDFCFCVPIGNQELMTAYLEEAEKFLWDNFAKEESNSK